MYVDNCNHDLRDIFNNNPDGYTESLLEHISKNESLYSKYFDYLGNKIGFTIAEWFEIQSGSQY